MADWRVARSLDVLLDQINRAFPGRNKASDGSIGDAAHRTRDSDHNPWYGPGIVTARDFTHDPAHGLDIDKFTDELAASRDRRIKYIIANRQILDSRPGNNPWKWVAYHGSNPHTKHFHLSVMDNPSCDDTAPWHLPSLGQAPPPPPSGGNFITWGSGVRVRSAPRVGASVVRTLSGPTRVQVKCQKRGDMVHAEGHSNDAWAYVPALGGYISNIYIDDPAAWLPGVGECG